MNEIEWMGRRKALALGSVAAGSAIAASAASDAARASTAGLPIVQIQTILGASGSVANGVLSVEIDRNDLRSTLPGNIPVLPASQLNGMQVFQSLPGPHGHAFLNGDFCLEQEEVNPFIDALIAGGLVVQAFHQHLHQLSPLYWFVHYRGIGNALELARAVRQALDTTSVPLPQSTPSNPPTPYDPARLSQILGGPASVGSSGVVTVNVPRTDTIRLAGHVISPFLNIPTGITFQPVGQGGASALVVPDFALVASEIVSVLRRMRDLGWIIGCLYNQETDEQPQLYLSHQWKVGDPYTLAAEVRRGLDLTRSAPA